MRIKSYRPAKRGLGFSSSLLRIIAASAVAGMTLAQIRDKPATPVSASPIGSTNGRARVLCETLRERELPSDTKIQRDRANGSIKLLSGSDLSIVLAQNPDFVLLQRENRAEEIASCFLAAYKDVFKLYSPLKELEPVLVKPGEISGSTHVRFRQVYFGLPVYGGEINVFLSPEKKVYRIEGRYFPTPAELGTHAFLNDREATSLVRELLEWNEIAQRRYQTEGAIYIATGNKPRLAYHVQVHEKSGQNWEVWIDANTGELLQKSRLADSRI